MVSQILKNQTDDRMIHRKKLIKTLVLIFSIILIILVVVILFISPITKYVVEKYDIKYTGRQITMDWAYVNPATGYIHFSELEIHELNSDSIFLSSKGVSANIALSKLFSRTFEISELTLEKLNGVVIQDEKEFNFNDLIRKFTPKKEKSTSSKSPFRFNILKIDIKDSEIHYIDKQVPVDYFIKNVNIESDGKRWNVDSIAIRFSFLSGTKSGDMKGIFSMNFKNKNYRFDVAAHKYDLKILEPYLKDLKKYGSFSAYLEADLKAKGNFKDATDVTFSGLLALNDFHYGKNPKEDYGSFDNLAVSIYELSPKNNKYLFDSVTLKHPFFRYERYDELDNLQNMFGKFGSNLAAAKSSPSRFNLVVTIGKYIKVLSTNFFRSDYHINRLAIHDGNLEYNDYSLSEKFAVALNPLNFVADSIDKKYKRVNVYLKSGIKPYGNAYVSLSINPKDSGDFDLKYMIEKIPVSLFNPYTIAYTSYPLDRGTIGLNGTWKVRNSIIKSHNHLLIIDPRVTKRTKNKNSHWLPVPLLMSFLRENNNVIDYEIPITGDLKNPKFQFRDIFFDLLTNIFVKPPTIPYRIQVKNIESDIEKSLTLKWEMRNSSLVPDQEKFIKRMAEFLVKNPKASIRVNPQLYTAKEKEYMLFFEAKKKYFLAIHPQKAISLSEKDSVSVEKMSIKNSLFIRYLNKQITDSMLFTVQEKCSTLIGENHINVKFRQLNKERVNTFISYFKKEGVEKRVIITSGKSIIPYNGYSFFKIKYKGEYPKTLLKAYKKMNDLNNKAPRKKFKKERN